MLRPLTLAIALLVLPALSASGRDWNKDQRLEAVAEQGDAEAAFILALLHANGDGVPQDYKTAAKWYALAPEQGHPSAQYNLGELHRSGRGVLQDYKAAVRLYRLAAEQGVAHAHNNLGFMYENGYGVLQDFVRAHMRYNIAASVGGVNFAPGNRDGLAKRMTPAQIAEAQDLARECVAKNYKGC